jgi:amino acid adenylation domain-containing protein
MTPYPVSVQARFFEIAAQHPQAIAVETPGRHLSYGELACRARGVAAALRARQVPPGAMVAIACADPADFIAALIGVLAAGGVACPLDPAWPERRTAQLLDIAEPAFALTMAGGAAALQAMTPDWRNLETIELGPDWPAPDWPADNGAPIWPAQPDSPCYAVFTSGSTGRPKAIIGRTSGLAQFIDWEIRTFGVTAADVIPLLTSVGFDAVLRDIFTPLGAGARIVAPADRSLLADAEALAAWLGQHAATLWHTTPSLLRHVLRPSPHLPRPNLPSLRLALAAGEPLLPSDVQAWFTSFGDRAELVNLYGPSETTMIKLFHRVTRADAARARIPIGRPIDGCRAIVLNAAGAPAGVGVVDEIYLRTPYRSLGYLRQPELTDAVFVANPLTGAADDIVYRTGDLGRMDEDGSFEFFGRIDWQIKIRGVRVEPAEVEDALRRHSQVLDIAVVGHAAGEAEMRLCAYVVLRDEASIDDIRAFGATRLPEIMVPSFFIPVPLIPRNSNGKVERAALPDPNASVAAAEYVAPRNPVEQAVVDILMEVLEVDVVSVTASFFTIGGHSLLIMQVLSRIEEAFGVLPPLADILEKPTAETMAAVLEQALREQSFVDDELQALIDQAPFDDIKVQTTHSA